jgi:Abortive infection alpha
MSDPSGSWAKAAEKGAEATTELVGAARDLGGSIAPAFRQLVGMAEDQFLIWRAERQIRLAERFKEFLRQRGLDAPTRPIAPSIWVQLTERASIEEDDQLQDVWATMLANAADADSAAEMRSAFVSMLGEMTHLDVVILARLSAASSEPEFNGVLPTSLLPEKVGDDGKGRLPTGKVAVSLGNLGRLACIHPTSGFPGWLHFGRVTVTDLGKAFVVACTPVHQPPRSSSRRRSVS